MANHQVGRLIWLVEDIADLLERIDVNYVFGIGDTDADQVTDPVIHFYEPFLAAYDNELRNKRGVYFTPRPVVSFIVRSVHELLQMEFELEDGLASTASWGDMQKKFPSLRLPKGVKASDSFVCILDPATGTGTFLYESIEVIERTMKTKWCKELKTERWDDPVILARWKEYVPRHLLTRLYGFELMMASYSIAHLKLAFKLGETGYILKDNERLHVYLTNSLEKPSDKQELTGILPAMAKEAHEVNEIKRLKCFTVVIGNPPYSNYSANLTPEARKIVDKYRNYNGIPIKERNQLQFERNIQDDFVKFISIGDDYIQTANVGVLSYITNATMLASSSLRGMRENLTNGFDKIFEMNLHGGGNEIIENVEQDENVFDIVQAVAIHTYIRSINKTEQNINYSDLLGKRSYKYSTLLSHTIANTNSVKIRPNTETCSFLPQDDHELGDICRLDKIVVKFGAGIKTNRDAVVIGLTEDELIDTVRHYDKRLVTGKHFRENIHSLLYRPFDMRQIFYHEDVVASRSLPTMKHIIAGPNIGLIGSSTWTTPERFSVNVSCSMVEMKTGTHDRGTTFFPLYRYEALLNAAPNKVHNFTKEFISVWSSTTQTKFVPKGRGNLVSTSGPEDIFFFLYGLFHSLEYRRRFKALLAQGFPIVLLSSNKELLKSLIKLGSEVADLHLFSSKKLNVFITKFVGIGDNSVPKKPTWKNNAVWVNKTQYFNGVPEDVWNFHIGGYPVCEKWLKDRKGRTLSTDDIAHYQKIIVAISETIRLMAEIDKVIDAHGGWPGAFQSTNGGAK